MIDMDCIDVKLRELTSEQLHNFYKFLKYAEEVGYLYIGRNGHNKLFLTKERVAYDTWEQDWKAMDGDLVFDWNQISCLVENALFGHVPIEFEDGEQVATCELTIEIECINKERGHNVLSIDSILAKVREIEGGILSLCAMLKTNTMK